jgi:hypothetical protein
MTILKCLFVATAVLAFQAISFAQGCPTGAISLSPTSQTVSANGGNSTFNLNATGGCTWTATTTDTWLHPQIPNGSGSLVLPFSFDANPDLCPRSGTIKATLFTSSGSTSANETVNQSAVVGDFSLSVTPASRTVLQGNGTNYSVSISRSGSFTGNIVLSLTGQPSGVTASFSPITNNTSTLTVNASANAATGSFSLVVKGVNSCQTRTAPAVNLQIIPVPSQAAYFIGTDQHVHETSLTSSGWFNTDISSLTGNVAALTTGLSSYKNGTNHNVYFVGTNQHVYELAYANGAWNITDLTAASAAPFNASSTSALTSFTTAGPGHSVYYVDINQHLNELNFNGSAWHNGDLTSASSTTARPSSSTGLSSFTNAAGGISVYYVGSDQSLYEMNFNGSSWHNGNLTAAGTGPSAALNSGITSFLAPSGGISVYYISSSDQHLHEMNFNTSSWHDGDLTNAGTGIPARLGTGLTSFRASSGGISVYYVGNSDLNIHEMNFNLMRWHDGNVTAAGSGPQSSGNGGLSSFIAPSGGISVFYLGSGPHLDDLNFNTSFWSNGDLSAITGGFQPAAGSAITSFLQ